MLAIRGLLLRHGARRCASGMCFSSSAADSGLYEALGVDHSASPDEIKSAFRKKAKVHHPDVRGPGSTHFAIILRAYQVLSDPAQRELYDLQHDPGSPQYLRRAASQKRVSDNERVQYSWQWVNDLQETRPARQGSNIDRLRAELAAEFRDAMLHAYHGPHVDMSDRRLPQAFEADERSDTAAPDILQLLSGRQLLGVVRERKDPLLACSEARVPLEDPTLAQQLYGGEPDVVSAAGPASVERHVPHSSQAASNRQHGGRQQPQRRVLELLLHDGEVAAMAVQQHAKGGAAMVEVFRDGRLVYTEADGRVVKPQTQRGNDASNKVSSGDGRDLSTGKATVGARSELRPTHRAVLSRTPLVKHLDWVALKGTGGLKRDRLVGRARRAWLPPPATWLFKPRNATHTTGGWYFEWVGYDSRRGVAAAEHPAWLDPLAMVLRAAFETLQVESEAAAEAEQAAFAAPAGLWRRLKSKVVG